MRPARGRHAASAVAVAVVLLAGCAPTGETREIGPGLVAADPSPPPVTESGAEDRATHDAGDTGVIGPGVVAAEAADGPVVEQLDLGVVRGVHLTLRPTSDGAEVVDASGTVVVGPTAARDDAPGTVGATGVVGGEALVQVGTVPDRFVDGRVFYTVLSGLGRGTHAFEVPTFRLPGDDRSWYVVVVPDLRGSGLADTTSGIAFAGADGVLGCASSDVPRECGIGDEEVADVELLLRQPPA